MTKDIFEKIESFLIEKIEQLEKENNTESGKKRITKLRKELIELRLNSPHLWSNFNLLY